MGGAMNGDDVFAGPGRSGYASRAGVVALDPLALVWMQEYRPLLPRKIESLLQVFLVVGAAVVVILWICFFASYPITRDVYFTLALVHVLAEVPFLLRAL